MTATTVHHVDTFYSYRTHDWGWQCFSCGESHHGFESCVAAGDAADEHEGACACASH